MKKLLLLSAMLLATLTLAAQQVIKHDDIGRFTAVAISGAMNVEFTLGEQSAIEIETTGGATVDLIEWNVNKQGLSIVARPSVKMGMATVRVTYTLIERLQASGADVMFRSTIQGEIFSADLASGAKFSGGFDCFDMEMRLVGGSVAQITGTARYATLVVSQRSSLDATALQATAAFAEAYSNSNMSLRGEGVERLVAETNMGSRINYSGKPRILRTLTKMGGNVSLIEN